MTPRAYERTALAFGHGGLVTTREAEEFLRVEHDTIKRAALEGRIRYVVRPWGRSQRYLVRADDAERVFGIPAAAGHEAMTA